MKTFIQNDSVFNTFWFCTFKNNFLQTYLSQNTIALKLGRGWVQVGDTYFLCNARRMLVYLNRSRFQNYSCVKDCLIITYKLFISQRFHLFFKRNSIYLSMDIMTIRTKSSNLLEDGNVKKWWYRIQEDCNFIILYRTYTLFYT